MGLVSLLLLVGQAFAQSPEAFKYQAVVRDASNSPVANQAVGVRLSVLEGSASGTAVYQETHSPTTSAIGLMSVNVGEGTAVSGVFADIDWASADYFLQVEADAAGGTNYAVLGASQLLSVPYSLYATEAESVPGDDDQDSTNEIQELAIAGNDLSITDGNTVTLPTFTGGNGIVIDNNVISTDGAASVWRFNSDTTALFTDTSRIGIGAEFPLSQVDFRYNANSVVAPSAISNDSVVAEGVSLAISKASNSTTNNAIGIGFGSSTDVNLGIPTIGAAIIHERIGGTSIGNLHFATKNVFVSQPVNIPIHMTITADGNVGVGTTTPASKFVVDGNADIIGTISKGGGSFKIDHPLDPANKYLYHSFVESPDMMNIYNGNIVTDAQGFATIELPDYFMALNGDFRYQLTVIGSFAQAIVKEEVSNGQFVIQTSDPSVKVSWQVTGIRHDEFAKANRIPNSIEKEAHNKGRYLYPELYGQPASMQVDRQQASKTQTETSVADGQTEEAAANH